MNGIPPSHYELTEPELIALAVFWAEMALTARQIARLLEDGAVTCAENARRWARRATEYLEIAEARR